MKKNLSLILPLCLITALVVGCANNNAAQSDISNPEMQNNPVEDVKKVDVDLTELSSTMVFAEVNNIMTNPDDYMGKKIKMNGVYASEYWDETGIDYHYVVIQDATGCCPQGIEFVWNGEHNYPDDYPEKQTEIEVIGIFGSYDELGRTYYFLTVDDISVLTEE
jgi:hypothetical protein